jgi:hypothetical protein
VTFRICTTAKLCEREQEWHHLKAHPSASALQRLHQSLSRQILAGDVETYSYKQQHKSNQPVNQ